MNKTLKYQMPGPGRGQAAIWFILLVLVLTGCGSEAPKKKRSAKPSAAVEEGSTSPKVTAQVAEEIQAPANEIGEYRYEPRGRRDPFRSVLEMRRNKRTLADLPPLQRLELSDMQLSGIIWGGMGYSALITTPDGKGYTVRTGTILGPRGGVVRKITKTEIIIQETVEDIFGTKKIRDIVKELHPQEEGKE